MIAAEASWADVAIIFIQVLGSLGTAMVAGYFGFKLNKKADDAAEQSQATAVVAQDTNTMTAQQMPVIKAIDDAVNGRGPGEPTLSEDVATARERHEAQDAAAGDPTVEVAVGAADRAAGATSDTTDEAPAEEAEAPPA